ncbi:lipid IV(A) 3-deoxy-D-manno-octulosonic acid transferase [Candidatus Thiothrix anitrata]|uniref:3-deoxy-D-manno-octulosonic acid transferase n=1 Tax=Candidatus Thiothrix anitrata TaxID=2823902 RepID=A0ABX7WYX3_9GAMM|nr:lipid IV(A) 3-deoxy-D-manno-octulosonic acid transferase [Candidatus Thiothrix anitrata]QTR48845.1 lipid IV(A) 3-deoxy-D-manno-octulosonic acid transferase [Candidatus Thiothrix anitrata]
MTRFFYSLAFYLLLPVLVLRLWWRGRSNPAYRQRLAERFGFVRNPSQQPCVWVHSVSVGETLAARPLVEHLLQTYPAHRIWITTTTPTGSDTVKRLYGARVQHSYFPYDLPDAMARFLQRVQPQLLLVMETEIWPNLYAACQQRGIPLLLLNARLSERSFQRYRKLGALTRDTLRCIRWIGARSTQDAHYFQQLGATPAQIGTCGNLKFALQIPAGLRETAHELKQQWGERPVLVAASTHAGEDEIVLRVFTHLQQTVPNALLILVPRHPERFDNVYQQCSNAGLTTIRRSAAQIVTPNTAVLLGDSMGEMLLWFAVADIAFIGGSLVAHGGHNPLEAAAFGVPVVSGTHTHNFPDIFPALYAAGGAVEISDENTLYSQCLNWLQNLQQRQQVGANAAQFFAQQQGVLACIMQPISALLSPNLASQGASA